MWKISILVACLLLVSCEEEKKKGRTINLDMGQGGGKGGERIFRPDPDNPGSMREVLDEDEDRLKKVRKGCSDTHPHFSVGDYNATSLEDLKRLEINGAYMVVFSDS